MRRDWSSHNTSENCRRDLWLYGIFRDRYQQPVELRDWLPQKYKDIKMGGEESTDIKEQAENVYQELHQLQVDHDALFDRVYALQQQLPMLESALMTLDQVPQAELRVFKARELIRLAISKLK